MANVHTQLQREFIVRKLAAFEPPRSIVLDFCAVFADTACNENDVMALDPEVNIVAPELHALFLRTREAVLIDPRSAPFADQKARLIALSADAKFYGRNNQLPERRAVLRQIAEECEIVGGKGAGKVAVAPAETVEPVIRIERIVVDPVAAVPAA